MPVDQIHLSESRPNVSQLHGEKLKKKLSINNEELLGNDGHSHTLSDVQSVSPIPSSRKKFIQTKKESNVLISLSTMTDNIVQDKDVSLNDFSSDLPVNYTQPPHIIPPLEETGNSRSKSSTTGIRGRKYRQSTIIKDGILEKWTNYLGAWRARYFIVEPGILKYANGPGQPIKETYPLVLCSTRFCPGDNMRLEVEHPHGVLYLRMPSPDEKKRWIDALLTAKNAFQQTKTLQSSRRRLTTSSSVLTVPVDEVPDTLLDKTQGNVFDEEGYSINSGSGDEKSPMIALLENCISCRQSAQSAGNNIRHTQAMILRLAGQVRDPQFREDIKNLSLRLVEALDLFQVIINRHLLAAKTLAVDEHQQRAALEKSLCSLAKRNYRMRTRLQDIQEYLIENKSNNLNPKWIVDSLDFDVGKSKVVQTRQAQRRGSAPEMSDHLLNDDDVLNKRGSDTESTVPVHWDTQVQREKDLASLLARGAADDDEEEDEFSSGNEDHEDTLSHGIICTTVPSDDVDQFFDVEEMTETPITAMTPLDTERSIETYHYEASGVAYGCNIDLEKITRRTALPTARTEFKISLWSILKDCIGKDLSRVSMPVYFNEPTSFLQRLAEDFQYSHLLKSASNEKKSVDRLSWVALFSISPYASTIGRTYKPFNPLLGETFEISHRGFRFLAEQVRHHPPVTAYYADSAEFEAWGHIIVKNRFTGKSVEVAFMGTSNILLKLRHSTDDQLTQEHYTLQRAKAIVNNVIFGKLTLEMFGCVVITNHTTGDCAFIEYLRQGWWSRELHVVRGIIFDTNGVPRYRLGGWWNCELWIEELVTQDEMSTISPAELISKNDFIESLQTDIKKKTIHCSASVPSFMGKNDTPCFFSLHLPQYRARNPMDIKINWDVLTSQPGSRRVLWRAEPRPPNASRYYEFSQMALELNDLSLDYDRGKGAPLPPTDSRNRMDQRYLEEGDTERANAEKNRLEEKQRSRARNRLGGEAEYQPKWFKKDIDSLTGQQAWVFSGDYWRAKLKNDFADCISIF